MDGFPKLKSFRQVQKVKVEEVSMNKKCQLTKSFLSVTLPYRCNSYVRQV